jgi:hypothetical protein
MASITIRNPEDDLKRCLRIRAAAKDESSIYFTAVGKAGLPHGAGILPTGRRLTAHGAAIDGVLYEDFCDLILSRDREAASAATRHATGRPLNEPSSTAKSPHSPARVRPPWQPATRATTRAAALC